ncbi:MAG: hypothetical protein V3V96_15160, partial [Acidiferrobacterales bacterium]
MVFVILGLWFVLLLALNFMGIFEARAGVPPLAFGLSVIGPPIVFAILYLDWTEFRRSVLSFDLKLLTAIQAWRVVGVVFLILYVYDLLPGTFAWPAGVGDIL